MGSAASKVSSMNYVPWLINTNQTIPSNSGIDLIRPAICISYLCAIVRQHNVPAQFKSRHSIKFRILCHRVPISLIM
jgi:hypothetical protein